MKRLLKSKTNKKTLYAEWQEGDINDPNMIQYITDVMANGGQMQIEYNGEWKTILPYGWNSSKDGNVLLMCYKDTGEVRSYRLDRMTDIQYDSDTIDFSLYEGGENDGEENIDLDYPTLPDEELEVDNNGSETPFDGALDALERADKEIDNIVPLEERVKNLDELLNNKEDTLIDVRRNSLDERVIQ